MLKAFVYSVVLMELAAFFGACQSKKSQNEQEALAGIKELHQKDIKASKAKDFDTLLSLWTDDGVLLEPGKTPVIGKEALKAYMDEQAKISQTYEIKKYEHKWGEIKVTGDWAFEWGFFDAEAEMKESGEIIKQRGKLLRILKKQKDGSWKCARAIGSYDEPSEDE